MKTMINKELHRIEAKTVKKEDIPNISATIKPITMEEYMQWQRKIMREANEQHKKLMESLGIDTTNTHEDLDYDTIKVKE